MSDERNPLSAVQRALARAEKFFTEDIWTEPTEVLQWERRAWRHFLRFATRVVDGFRRHQLPMRAASLAYTSLLALVPLLAVALSVSKELLQQTAEEFAPQVLASLVNALAPQLREVPSETTAKAQQEVVERLQGFIANINAHTLGVSGFILLVVVAVSLLVSVEATLNDIWGVSQGRYWIKKIVYYTAAVTIGPLLIFEALQMTARREFAMVKGKLAEMPFVESLWLTVGPFVVLWLLFAFFNFSMPSAKVRWRCALLGGVASGTLWQLNNLCAFVYMPKVAGYTTIYGALAQIPIFLIGLYFSWFIVLLGAEVAYAAQHFRQKPAFGPPR